MKKISLFMIITAILLFYCKHYKAEEHTGSFEDYRVQRTYTGPKAPIEKDDLEHYIKFKTRITEGYKKNIDFAGQYIWVQWGCGTSCQVNVIIDAETGKIFAAPQSSLGVEYKSDSTMIIVDPYGEGEKKQDRPDSLKPPTYYSFDGKQFSEIKGKKIIKRESFPAL